jgi:hypothetical protein
MLLCRAGSDADASLGTPLHSGASPLGVTTSSCAPAIALLVAPLLRRQDSRRGTVHLRQTLSHPGEAAHANRDDAARDSEMIARPTGDDLARGSAAYWQMDLWHWALG